MKKHKRIIALLIAAALIWGIYILCKPKYLYDENVDPKFWISEFAKAEYATVVLPEGKTRIPAQFYAEWLKETDFKLDQDQIAKESIPDYHITLKDSANTEVLYQYSANDGSPRVFIKTQNGRAFFTFSPEQYNKLNIQIMSSSYFEP